MTHPALALGKQLCEALGLDPAQIDRIEMVIDAARVGLVRVTVSQSVVSPEVVERVGRTVREYRAIPAEDFESYLDWKRAQS